MRDRLALGLLLGLRHLPLGPAQRLGRATAGALWPLARRARRVTRANLAACFPEADEAWRAAVARESFRQLGAALFEAPRLWRTDGATLTARLDNPAVLHEILERYRRGEGLVIACPHLGSWEYIGLLFAHHTRMTNLYRPPRMASLDGLLRDGRQHTGATLVPTDASGVRALARALAQGECIGILPDQEPQAGAGTFAPFFDQPALTMTLLTRLVRKRRTPVCFVVAERRRGGRFRLHHHWAEEALYHPEHGPAALNRSVERLVRALPGQYNWAYKRFRERPPGLAALY